MAITLADVGNGTVAQLFSTINGNNDKIEGAINTPIETTQIADGAITVDKLSKTSDVPDIFNIFYPVGTYYWSSVNLSSNPQWSRGPLDYGTWERVQGRVLVGIGSTTLKDGTTISFVAGESGGEKTHTLTENEMPSHTHTIPVNQTTQKYVGGSSGFSVAKIDTGSRETSSSTGGGAAHNNMPPYITAYCWIRTA